MLAGGFGRWKLGQALSHWPVLPVSLWAAYSSRSWQSWYGVGGIGLEPTTFAMSTQCSNQLSYPPWAGKYYKQVVQKWQASKGSNSELAESIIEQHHFAARNGGSGYNYLNPTDYEWFHLKLISTYNYGLSRPYNAEYLNSCLNTALLHSNWIIIMAHGIGNDQNSIPKEDITKHFDYLASKLDSVWCGTFNEVTKYIREKQHAVLKINKGKSSGIIIKLTHDLNSNIFNFPLTLKTIVPANWKIGSIEQNGLSKKVLTKFENGYNYIVYEAIPNAGDIKLSKF